MEQHIQRPIFIVGVGRSGTSLIYRLLASHRETAWFSNWTNRFPGFPQLALFSRLPSYRLPSAITRAKPWPKPHVEGNNIYRLCGIHSLVNKYQRALTGNDVPPKATDTLTGIIAAHLKYQNRDRFLHKNTNNSLRIRYLNSVFPDARFIHIVRDGRAVAQSLCHVDFWADMTFWWSGKTTGKCEAGAEERLVLAGMHWAKTALATRQTAEQLPPDQYMEVHYEEFTAAPREWLLKLQKFCELTPDNRCATSLSAARVRNLNRRWDDTFTASAKTALWNEIRDTAALFGYT